MKRPTNHQVAFLGVFLCLSYRSAFAAESASGGALLLGKQVALRLEPGPGNPRNSEGDFIQLKDGRILFVYSHFVGGSWDHAAAYLAGRYSHDGGRTWSDHEVVVVPNEGAMNVMSVSLLRLPDGRIALFYLRKNSIEDCAPLVRFSDDEAQTWSQPTVIADSVGYYVMNNDRVVLLSNGRIMVPVSLHNTPNTDWTAFGRILCFYSDDNGKTWRRSQYVPNPGGVMLQEPGVVELKDSRLMLFCRTNTGCQYASYSSDRGFHWTPARPSTIRSPLSPASIERIPATGDLLLVWNNPASTGGGRGARTPLNLAISRDEGKTWEKEKAIESDPKGWYCYTAIEFVGDHVLLAHCAGDRRRHDGLATTQITRLSLDWIYADQTPNPYVRTDSAGIVELACAEPAAEIHYTLNRTLPSLRSPLYSEPIRVDGPTLLMMQALGPHMTPSEIVTTIVGQDVPIPPRPPECALSPGLTVRYVEGSFVTADSVATQSPAWTGTTFSISLDRRGRDADFGFLFEGYLRAPVDGTYRFFLRSNDGSLLYLDGRLLIDNDGPHSAHEESTTVTLRAGYHAISLRYFQRGGSYTLELEWQPPGSSRGPIPADVWFHCEK